MIWAAWAGSPGDIHAPRPVWTDLAGGGVSATERAFFLSGGDRPDIPLNTASLECCQALCERSDRGTVIQGMTCQDLASHFERRLGKRDKVTWPYQAGNLARFQPGIYQQVFNLHRPGSVIRGEQMGRRLDYQAWQISPPVHGDDLPGEHTRVEATHLGEAQETFAHPGDHQTNCIHMGSDEQAMARLGS